MDKFKIYSIKNFFREAVLEKFSKEYVSDKSVSRLTMEFEEFFASKFERNFDEEERNWISKRIEDCKDIDSWKPHVRILTKEEILSHHGTSFKMLKEFVEKHHINENALILVERIEDFYYHYNSWGVLPVKDEAYYNCLKWNEDIDEGKYLNKEKYPNIDPKSLKKFTEEELERAKSQYHPVWCPIFAEEGDKDLIFLCMHY